MRNASKYTGLHRRPCRAAPGGVARRLRKRLAVAAGAMGMVAVAMMGSTTESSFASSPLLAPNSQNLTYVYDDLSWPSLDPASSVSEGPDNPIYSLIYGNLFTVGPGGKAVPGMATGYSFSDNNLTFSMKLQSGVKFQDGTPFNSTAVKDSLERDISPTLGCSCIPALSAIKSISTPTSTEVVIHLSRPDGVLVPALETSGASFVTDPTALAKDGEKKYSLNPVGAGPFQLVNNIENSSMTLDAWPGYFDAKAIHLKSVKVLSENSSSTELATVQGGAAQLLSFIGNPTEQKGALADSNLQVTTQTIGANFVYLNPGAPPFNSKVAREALFYATDQSAISKAVYDGFAPPTQQLVGAGQQGFVSNKLPGFSSYNPGKAKALVKQLGGLKVTLLPLVESTIGLEESEALEKQWDSVGINTTINQEQFATVLAQMEKADYEAIIAGYPPQTDAALALVGTLACKSFFDPDYCNNTMANDEKKALTSQTFAQQGKLVQESMVQAISRDHVYLPLVQNPTVWAASKSLHGYHIYGGNLYLANAYFS